MLPRTCMRGCSMKKTVRRQKTPLGSKHLHDRFERSALCTSKSQLSVSPTMELVTNNNTRAYKEDPAIGNDG